MKLAHRDGWQREGALALRCELDGPAGNGRLQAVDELDLRVRRRVKNLKVTVERAQVGFEPAGSAPQLQHQAHALAGVDGVALEARGQFLGARARGGEA